jgi:hypothetical protein
MGDETRGRFAEMAMELLGAQAAEKLLDQVWMQASPEAKRRLADSLLDAVGKVDSWNTRHVAESYAREIAKEHLETRREEFERVVRETIAASWEQAVRRAVQSSLDDVIRETKARMR